MSIADEAELYLRTLAAEPERPYPGECLRCYVRRMVSRHGCNSRMRWVGRWQRTTPGSTRGLQRQLQTRGGYCDCEVLLNVFHEGVPAPTAVLAPCPHGSSLGPRAP